MPDRRRTITLTVRDEFSSELRQFADQMDKAGGKVKSFDKQASRGFRDTLGALRDMTVVAAGVYSAFQKVTGTASEWAEMGKQAERSEYALRQISASAEDYASKIDAITAATKRTVTEGEAAALAFQLQQRGIASSASEMERFTRIAAIVGAASPQLRDTSEAINEIALTLSNQSFMRLDQLGVSAGEVRKRMAELKQETKDLSTEEAFQIALMEKLEQQANQVGDAILDVGNAQERFNTRVRSFKENAGMVLAEGFEGAAIAADGLLTVIEKLVSREWDIEFVITRTLTAGGVQDVVADATMAGLGEMGFILDYFGVLPGANDAGKQVQQNYNTPDPGLWVPSMLTGGSGFWMGTGGGPQFQNVGFGPGYGMDMAGAANFAPFYKDDLAQFQAFAGTGQQSYLQQFAPSMQGMADISFGGVGGAFDMTQFAGVAELRDTFGELPGFIQNANSLLGDTLSAVAQIGENGELIVTQWDSLNQKFGVTPTGFDSDVYSRGADALREAGIEAEDYERAMMALGLATGVTTTQNELFNARMGVLSQQLSEGSLSVEDWVTEITKLGAVDLSWVDQATEGMDFDEIEDFINTLADTELEDGAGADTFQPLVDSAVTATDDIQSAFDESSEGWIAPIGEFVAKGGAEFGVLRESAAAELSGIQSLMASTFGGTYTFTVTGTGAASGTGTPAGVGTLGTFAEGGFTGDGAPGSVAGVVHSREYVVPERGALVVRGGGGGGGTEPIEIKLMLDGREIHRANIDVEERQAGVR